MLLQSSETRPPNLRNNLWGGVAILDNRLVERSYGDYEGESSSDFHFNDFWKYDIELGNVERLSSIEKRVYSFFDEITKKYPGKNILIVTHGGTIRITKGYFLGKPQDNDYMTAFGMEKNSAVLVFDN